MSAGSLERICHAIRVHLRPDLGSVLLSGITSQMVQTYVYKKSESYREMHFELYQQIKGTLQRAVWEDLLSISPLDVKKVRMPQRPRSTRTIPTIEEGRALWQALEHEGRSNARISSHCNITRMTTTRSGDVRRHERRRNIRPAMGARQFRGRPDLGAALAFPLWRAEGTKGPVTPSRYSDVPGNE